MYRVPTTLQFFIPRRKIQLEIFQIQILFILTLIIIEPIKTYKALSAHTPILTITHLIKNQFYCTATVLYHYKYFQLSFLFYT